MPTRTKTFPENASPRKRPTFFWQGALILLPVAVLTGLGVLSIREDRRLALVEAQEQAGVALRLLTNRVVQLLPARLSEAENVRSTGQEPGSDRSGESEPVIRFGAHGRLLDPRPYPVTPHPPRWFRELSPKQRAAWQTARTELLPPGGGGNGTAAVDAFLSTEPAEEARLNVRFERLRAEARASGATPGFAALLGFAEANLQVLSPAGIPLHALALGDALRQSGSDPAIEDLLSEAFTVQVDRCPSFLTERLLLEAMEPSRPKPELDWLLSRWRFDQELRQLTAEITPSERTTTSPIARWLSTTNVSWLALIGPEVLPPAGERTNSVVSEAATRVRLVAKRDLQAAFAETLFQESREWPAYGELTVAVQGLPLEIPPSGQSSAQGESAPLLAELSGAVDRIPIKPSTELAAANLPSSTPSDPLPASLNYRLTLHLGDPDLLYARHRRRTLFFAALLAMATATAGIGWFSAHRAFHRQLRLSDMKSNFVSSVSHELRAPIASVRLLAESLDRGTVKEESKRKAYFRLIVQECRRLSSLITNVLDFSRIDQGRRRYEFESVEVTALVEETVGTMIPYAAERGVRLNLQRDDGASHPTKTPPIVDGKALQQALVNLIDNAVKHSPSGEEVRVGIEFRSADSKPRPPGEEQLQTKGTLRLSVEDAGPGVPPSDRTRIFEPFVRRGSELRRETTGVGIGLNIVRHVVEAHCGRVWVESRTEKGSRFVIEIPIRTEVTV